MDECWFHFHRLKFTTSPPPEMTSDSASIETRSIARGPQSWLAGLVLSSEFLLSFHRCRARSLQSGLHYSALCCYEGGEEGRVDQATPKQTWTWKSGEKNNKKNQTSKTTSFFCRRGGKNPAGSFCLRKYWENEKLFQSCRPHLRYTRASTEIYLEKGLCFVLSLATASDKPDPVKFVQISRLQSPSSAKVFLVYIAKEMSYIQEQGESAGRLREREKEKNTAEDGYLAKSWRQGLL